MDVSAVIPTRNRPASLRRVLHCLSRQTLAPEQVVIIDASDVPLLPEELAGDFPSLRLRVLHAAPGLCAQRNLGIRTVTSDSVFLCDDDIEFSPSYLATLTRFLGEHSGAGAVSGEIHEQDVSGVFGSARSGGSVAWLFWSFLFQFTVWRDIHGMDASGAGRLLLPSLKRFYRKRGNTCSAAGWPLVTRMSKPVYSTLVYGLGACVVRRSWLEHSPFDESLHPSGIGDNYGVAIGFPGREPISVIADEPVRHYREQTGRMEPAEAFALRAFALDRFIDRSDRFTPLNRLMLRWSLGGYIFYYLLRGDGTMVKTAWRTLASLLLGRNPYLTTIHESHE